MPIYSHSQLSIYEECSLKYRLRYVDKIKRETVEGVEGFLGNRVHESLKKLYDDLKLTRVNSLPELLSYYDDLWLKNWHDSIVISKKDLTYEHYKALGRKMLETYYQRYTPFDSDITIGTEMRLHFALDDEGKYKLTGLIDRLSRTSDGIYQIHDYKTSASLPGQDYADNDRQLGLYHIAVKRRWPGIKNIRLMWHYLAFDQELLSSRSNKAIASLAEDTMSLIDEIESAEDFPPCESEYCEWCEYPDLCPARKHFHMVEALPANKYLAEPGVVLVNRYAELKEKASEIGEELEQVKEAIFDYARRENVTAIKGSNHRVRIRTDQKLKFPGKKESERIELEDIIVQADKWMEVSELDTTALKRAVEEGLWDNELIGQVLKYGRIEEARAVYLSKLMDEEE